MMKIMGNNTNKSANKNSNTDTRELALEMLMEINERGQFSHIVLRSVLDKYQYLSKQDRAFMTRLVDGTIEYMLQLDYIIDQFSKTKVRKMKPLIRNLLRMSVYQIKYMDSVPDSAVCNEAVKIAKRHKFGQLSGFVNGVLRNIARNIGTIELPDLSVRYSMPQWIVERFVSSYGAAKTEEIFKNFQTKSSISIRTNLSACTPGELKETLKAEGVTVTDVPELDYAFMISDFDHLSGLESFNDGLFYVQDVSSMMVAETAAPKPGDHVIDVCAAPGGKSTHIAEKLNGTGHVEARDLTDYKVDMIEENIERHGLNNMSAEVFDATEYDEASKESADILICDLPCSGLGVMGRKKDIRYKISPDGLKDLAVLQRTILDTVHTYVKPGGVLVYSTCTIDDEENEKNVQWFLEKYPQYTLDKNFFDGKGMEQMLPGEHGNDGFFIARLIRSVS